MTDPQGYPVQQYTNLDNDIVLEVMSDGTIVLITGITISSGSGSPEGVVVAPVGSFYSDKDGTDPNIWYQKQTGVDNTGWVAIGGGGGGAVTSVFNRAGAVTPFPTDYSNVDNLTFGDSVGDSITFITGASQLQLGDAGTDLITLDGVLGKIIIHGVNELDLNSTLVQINGNSPIINATALADLQITDGVSQGLVFNSATGEVDITDGSGGDSLAFDGNGTSQLNGDTVVLLAVTEVQLNTPTVTIPTLPQIFANNAAAITGGLVAGNLYRTGADPDVICIVH